MLDSQVEIATTTQANTAVVHASHAQIVRDSRQAFLLNPQTDYEGNKGVSDTAIVSFRDNGSAQAINAKGHVHIVTADGAIITASSSQTELNDQSQPTRTDMAGGVTFASNAPDESMHGSAVSGTLTFGNNSMLKHAQFRDAVSFVNQVFRLANDPKGTASRQIQASKLDVDFVPVANKAVAQKALATGNASVNLHTIPPTPRRRPRISRAINCWCCSTSDGRAIRQLNGTGQTRIVNVAKDGSTNTSTGDRGRHLQPAEAGQIARRSTGRSKG